MKFSEQNPETRSPIDSRKGNNNTRKQATRRNPETENLRLKKVQSKPKTQNLDPVFGFQEMKQLPSNNLTRSQATISSSTPERKRDSRKDLIKRYLGNLDKLVWSNYEKKLIAKPGRNDG